MLHSKFACFIPCSPLFTVAIIILLFVAVWWRCSNELLLCLLLLWLWLWTNILRYLKWPSTIRTWWWWCHDGWMERWQCIKHQKTNHLKPSFVVVHQRPPISKKRHCETQSDTSNWSRRRSTYMSTAWPSGLRRKIKALVYIGVGSNPTAVIPFYFLVLNSTRTTTFMGFRPFIFWNKVSVFLIRNSQRFVSFINIIISMPKRGRKRKKSRTHVVENENNAASALTSNAEELKVPKTLVVRFVQIEFVRQAVETLHSMWFVHSL